MTARPKRGPRPSTGGPQISFPSVTPAFARREQPPCTLIRQQPRITGSFIIQRPRPSRRIRVRQRRERRSPQPLPVLPSLQKERKKKNPSFSSCAALTGGFGESLGRKIPRGRTQAVGNVPANMAAGQNGSPRRPAGHNWDTVETEVVALCLLSWTSCQTACQIYRSFCTGETESLTRKQAEVASCEAEPNNMNADCQMNGKENLNDSMKASRRG